MRTYAVMLISSTLALIVCEGQHSPASMGLLRPGDPGICTAADVADTVRQLIRPKSVASDAYTI